MGLSEEDKKRIPYFKQLQLEEERARWKKAIKSPEFVKKAQKFRFAFEDHLHQRIVAHFKAIEEKKPTVELVVSSTYYFTEIICNETLYSRPLITEKMLKRFDLVKKEKK